jgi:hypothetical protein
MTGLPGLSQTFTLTSFDSGKWILPSFLVNVTPVSNDTTFNLFTDSFAYDGFVFGDGYYQPVKRYQAHQGSRSQKFAIGFG